MDSYLALTLKNEIEDLFIYDNQENVVGFKENELNEIQGSNNRIVQYIEDLDDEINSLEYHVCDLESDLDNSKLTIKNLKSQLEEFEILFNFDTPENYTESEIFNLCIAVYTNNIRLVESDLQILKALANKTL